MAEYNPSRREMLSSTIAGAVALSAGAKASADLNSRSTSAMPMRRFGRHDLDVSLLCVGGYHIGMCGADEGIRIIQEAIDHGATFMDNAWEYHKGESEIRMGKALAGGRREKVFLMTKHHGRDKQTAMKHLEDSLKRLKTDYVDLWQYHEIVYDRDPDMIFGADPKATDAGIEAAELAKKQGKVRFVGFTGHKKPEQLLKMLAFDYKWDAVQMPLNPFDGTFQSFEKWVLPVLVKRGIAPLAMKTRGSGNLLKTGTVTVEECWRYAAALPVATIVSGMESIDLLRDNLRLAQTLKPMSPDEMEALRRKTTEAAATGKHEPYKSTINFDGPIGRELHGVKS